MRIYFRDNSTVIEVSELKDDAGNLVQTATVKAEITLENGQDAPGAANPIAMSHQGSGVYSAIVPPIDLPDGDLVVVEVESKVSDVVATSREKMIIRDRSFGSFE